MIMNIKIRDINDTDLNDDLWDALEHLSPVRPICKDSAKFAFWERKEMGIRTLVALIDDKIIGTASFVIEPKFLHSGSYVCHIEDVSVNPAYCGHGVASKLIQYIIDIATKAGAYKVILDCDDALIPFYQKQGFYLNCNAMRMNIK